MLFNQESYPAIENACVNHREIEFEAPIEITAFASRADHVPSEWTAFPPAALPPKGYAQILTRTAHGTLMALELIVHLDGGRILYKSAGEKMVSLRVTWPKTKP